MMIVNSIAFIYWIIWMPKNYDKTSESCTNACDKEKIGSFINFQWASLCHLLYYQRISNNKGIAKRHHPANDLFIIQHTFFHVLRNFFGFFLVSFSLSTFRRALFFFFVMAQYAETLT